MTYKTKGTCSTMIDIEMEPDQHTIKSVSFYRRLQRQLKRHFQPGSRHESRGRNRTFKGH